MLKTKTMATQQIKLTIYKLLDKIENKVILKSILELVDGFVNTNNELSPNQQIADIADQELVQWREQFMLESTQHLNALYSSDEPEYSESDLIETNPEFEPPLK